MAQKVLVQMLDDLDGSVANQTVPFSLDGVQYEIDLSDDNASELRDSLAQFISAGRRVGGRKMRLATGQSASETRPSGTADRERSRQIRAWAIEQGYEVAERGRIPADVVDAYDNRPPVVEEVPKVTKKRAPRKKTS